jgi:hypothetical protein
VSGDLPTEIAANKDKSTAGFMGLICANIITKRRQQELNQVCSQVFYAKKSLWG